jgi:hypothetical protein
MNILGWGLFGLGSLLLFIFAFVGTDVGLGIGGVANLAGTITGSAMMISGAVFVVGSKVVGALNAQSETGLQITSQEEKGMTEEEKIKLREHAEEKKDKEDEKLALLIVIALVVVSLTVFALAQ